MVINVDFMTYIVDDRLILIPVLYIIGAFIKKTSVIKNRFIPLILLIISILFSILMGGVLIDSIIQGILAAGGAVFTNEIIVQRKK